VQEKENLKKIIDDIWDYRTHRLSIDQMNEEKLQTFLDYDMPYSTKKYDNNISMLKAFVDLNLELTSFQKIKEQLGLGKEYF
jgi:hypothetical protein